MKKFSELSWRGKVIRIFLPVLAVVLVITFNSLNEEKSPMNGIGMDGDWIIVSSSSSNENMVRITPGTFVIIQEKNKATLYERNLLGKTGKFLDILEEGIITPISKCYFIEFEDNIIIKTIKGDDILNANDDILLKYEEITGKGNPCFYSILYNKRTLIN